MFDMLKPGLVLCLVCLVASLSLGLVSEVTKEPIETRRLADEKEARLKLLPNSDNFLVLDFDFQEEAFVKEVAVGIKSEKIVGSIFTVNTKGFKGAIKMFVAVDLTGKILGYEVLESNETPGLGDKITTEEFKKQYIDKNEKFVVVKSISKSPDQIEALTSATISSNAVNNGINAVLEVYDKIMQKGEITK